MLVSLSLFLVILTTSYTLWFLHVNPNPSPMVGKMMSMNLGMLSSLILGTSIGIVGKQDLTLAIVLSSLISLSLGHFIGKQISPLAMMEGMMSGLMGGMMGGMLGVMLPNENYHMMLSFFDVVYIILTIILFKVINQELDKNNKENNKRLRHTLTIMGVCLLITVLVVYQLESGDVGEASNVNPKQRYHSGR
jgi:hypothetical protein